MSDETEEFFHELDRRGREPLLANLTGSVQFDVVDGGRTTRWRLTIDKGDIAVSHKRGSADCAFRGNKALFDDIVAGRTNAMAAVLRGALVISGDLELMIAVQRIFPGPPREAPSSRAARSSK